MGGGASGLQGSAVIVVPAGSPQDTAALQLGLDK